MKTQILLFILIFISTSLFSQTDSIPMVTESIDSIAKVTEPTDKMVKEPVDTVFDKAPNEGKVSEISQKNFNRKKIQRKL